MSYVIPLLLGGAMFWIKLRQSRWSSPLLYGISVWVLTTMGIYTINAQHQFATEQTTRTTSDNVESRVRDWLNTFKLTARNSTTPPDLFRYTVWMPNGDAVDIVRTKDLPSYLVLGGHIVATPEDAAKVKTLTPYQRVRLFDALTLESAKAKVVFNNALTTDSLSMELIKRVPITPALSESTLIGSLDEVDSAMMILRTTLAMSITMPTSQ